MKDKTVTLSIGRDEEDNQRVFLNGIILETADQVRFNVVTHLNKPYIEVTLLVPQVDIQTKIDDIQLTTEAYRKCGNCGIWVIPNINADRLDEKIVTADYKCSQCGWEHTAEIQNWNNGIKEVEHISSLPDNDDVPRDEIVAEIKKQ